MLTSYSGFSPLCYRKLPRPVDSSEVDFRGVRTSHRLERRRGGQPCQGKRVLTGAAALWDAHSSRATWIVAL